MFRPALPLLRTAVRASPVRAAAVQRPAVAAALRAQSRSYAAAAGLSNEAITSRILDILKSFEKVDEGKLTPTSSFTTDLGLDSLDAVEVVMAIEEEFAIEIPDDEADAIGTVKEAIDYIAKTPEAH